VWVALERLWAGSFEAGDFLDGDEPGQTAEIKLRLTVEQGRLILDFAGSAPQLQSARNIPYRALIATVYTVVKSMLDPDIAANAGYFRTIDVRIPPGTVVGPVAPAAIR